MSTELLQMKWDDIQNVRINGRWITVCSIRPYELQLGAMKESKIQTCFWSDANMGIWVRIEDSENDVYYYPVTAIDGIR